MHELAVQQFPQSYKELLVVEHSLLDVNYAPTLPKFDPIKPNKIDEMNVP